MKQEHISQRNDAGTITITTYDTRTYQPKK